MSALLRRFTRVQVLLATLCLAVSAMGFYEAASDAPTIDEPVYVSAGLASLVHHDLRMNTQHPPLAKALAALPVLLADPVVPLGRVWAQGHDRFYARVFLQEARALRELHEITLLSRIVPLLELLASGLLVFALGRRLAGDIGGLFAAALWMLNPYVVGIGHVDGIDVPFTLATLAVVLALVRWQETPSLRRVAAVGAACGVAVLVRDTGPLLLLVALALVGYKARAFRPVLVVAGTAWLAVWLVYLVLDPGFSISHLTVLPQRYLDGLGHLASAHAGGGPAFLFGHLWSGGRWWFWPASMVIKLPASMLVAFVLVPLGLRRVPAEPRRHVLLALGPCAVLLTAFTVAAPADLGLRYLLPVVALLCVLAAPLVLLRPVVPAVLVAVGAAFTVAAFPGSIAWIAPPFGPGYAVASAGNLDWGQDAWRLQEWARGRRAWIACYTPEGSGCVEDVPGARRLTKDQDPAQVHGWVAMSATLRNLHEWHPWLRRLRPVGTIDSTELLYRVP